MMGYEGKQTYIHDTLDPYPWSGSVSWCLAEGYGNGDQRGLMSHSGSGRTLSFVYYGLVNLKDLSKKDFLLQNLDALHVIPPKCRSIE